MQEIKSNKSILIVIIIVVIIGAAVGVYFFTQNGNENTNVTTNTNTATTTNTASATNTVTNTAGEADPYADLMKYDNKVVEISSSDGKVTGQLAISIDKTQEMPIAVVYFMKVADALPKSIAAAGGSGASYYYIANHTTAAAVNVGDGSGSFSVVFCNEGEMPNVLSLAQQRSIDIELYRGCDEQYVLDHTATSFYHVYSTFHNNYDFDYDAIVGQDTLAVFDTAPYYEADAETGGWGADNETVIAQAEPTVTYDLLYTE